MRRLLLFALAGVVTVSLAFAQAGPQAGPKKEEKAKPDSTQTKETEKTEETKSKDDSKDKEKEKASKEKEKSKEKNAAKSDEAKKQQRKVEEAAETEADAAKAKEQKIDTQEDKQKTEKNEAKKEKEQAKSKQAKTEKSEGKPGKRFAGEEPWSGHLKRAVFTTAIEEREPVGSLDSLSTATEQVLFFTEIVGLEDHTVTHRWLQGGEVRAEVPIAVGGPRWRAYSSKKMLPTWTGEWVVEVVDADGSILGTKRLVYYGAE